MRRSSLGIRAGLVLALSAAACGDGDGGVAAQTCTAPGSSVEVGARDDLSFDAESYEASAGCIELVYVNEGNLPHTLLLKGISGFTLSIGDEDSGAIELEPGTYTLYCDIAGHEAAGMSAPLTVE